MAQCQHFAHGLGRSMQRDGSVSFRVSLGGEEAAVRGLREVLRPKNISIHKECPLLSRRLRQQHMAPRAHGSGGRPPWALGWQGAALQARMCRCLACRVIEKGGDRLGVCSG